MRHLMRGMWAIWGIAGLVPSFLVAQGRPDIEALRQRVREKGYTFEVGPNPATAYTLEELCGTTVPPDFDQRIKKAAPAEAGPIPVSFDWRKLEGCTPIKNQGGCGSCWAFATMGIVESQYLLHEGIELDFSEQWLVSCTDAGGCSGGWYGAALNYLIAEPDYLGKSGAPLEEIYPYEARDADCVLASDAMRYSITEWSGIQQDIDAMKRAIMSYGPIAVTVYSNDLFQCYVGGIFNAHEDGATNHAVVLVGWDDAQGKEGIWYLRNSWGAGWGENGYMRIEYGRNNVGLSPCYAVLTPENEPNELHVPSAFPSLSAAMAAAAERDSIILAPGVYTGPENTNIRFAGKSVTIRSVNPADKDIVAATVIDCQGSNEQPGRAFIFDDGEGPDSVVNGLTIRNGYPLDNGGAIYCYFSSPTIKNCVFENNVAAGYRKAGGAIALYNSNARILRCRIQHNSASSFGGGISVRVNSAPSISECDILDNTAGIEGGGLYAWVDARITLKNSVIAGNYAGQAGGGLFFYECTPADVNVPAGAWNTAFADPAQTNPNAPVVGFCTIADNSTGGRGGGLFVMDSIVQLHHSIVWNNQAGELQGDQFGLIDDWLNQTTLEVRYCTVMGLDQGHSVDARSVLKWGAGNINADPLFADSDGRDYHLKSAAGRWQSAINDWVLDDGGNYDPDDDKNSPCIDAGDPMTKVRSELPCHGGRINLGAYGSTEQASRSPYEKCCMQCLPGDFNYDCLINLEDLAIFMENWLRCNLLPRHYCI